MISRLAKNECTGCSACLNVCPRKCILMQDGQDGFLYPFIDESKCIHCNLCEKVCPSLNKINNKGKKDPIVKAAWSLDESIRFNSTSGGIFSELATTFLKDDGVVVGARYTENFLVEHYIIDKVEDVQILRQSKYIQSDKKNIFRQIKNLLMENKKVLFVGSPCEVGGLYSYLSSKYDNLITVDFVCLGANSPKVYLKFLEMLEEIYKSKIKKVWFKNKTYGWNRFSTKVEFENGTYYLKDRNHDYFMKGYIGENKFYMRECCTACRYKTIPRIADLTLADFWGIANKDGRLDADKGTSLVMLNSVEGMGLFEKLNSRIYSCNCELEDAIGGNPAIFNSVQLDARRSDFFYDLNHLRFDVLIKKYCSLTKKEQFKRCLRRVFKNIIMPILKKVKGE